MRGVVNRSGRRYGRLLVLNLADRESCSWRCRCDCGVEKVIPYDNLRRILSCGCLLSESTAARATTHGGSDKPEYRTWHQMRQRCRNLKGKLYHRYGGRGIRICERWELFENFFADMGPRPSPGHSLDRIDNDGNYEPGNCRWATQTEQLQNTSRCRYVTINGERLTQSEASKRVGLSRTVLGNRLRLGWSLEKAINLPLRPRNASRLSASDRQ
jgi:hypothetical protein